ncbi:MAG: hypothetical protein JKY37_24605 [Nannocystaceae bacterium]|nr:hypothetical protein [Nannocystaceae bacterium]
MSPMIVIDGASSAGKTSLIRAFSELVGARYQAYSIDGFLPSLAPGVFEARASTERGWLLLCRDFYHYLATATVAGGPSIVEVMLPWPQAREDLSAAEVGGSTLTVAAAERAAANGSSADTSAAVSTASAQRGQSAGGRTERLLRCVPLPRLLQVAGWIPRQQDPTVQRGGLLRSLAIDLQLSVCVSISIV